MRLIDADALEKRIKNAQCNNFKCNDFKCDGYTGGEKCRCCATGNILDAIDDEPTVEPVKYVHREMDSQTLKDIIDRVYQRDIDGPPTGSIPLCMTIDDYAKLVAHALEELGVRCHTCVMGDALDRCQMVDPVKHGHWEDSQSEIVGGQYHEVLNCSCCGWTYDSGFVGLRFCPNCGAKMDEAIE